MEVQQIVLEYMKLTLEYVRVLAWPTVVIFILLRYENYISTLLKRISEESEEITSSLLNVKFRKELQQLRDAIPADAKDLKEKVKDIEQELAIQQFIELAPQFFSEPPITRMHLAEIVEDLARSLELSSILHFANSNQRGERVAAGIALKQHILANPNTEKMREVLDALRLGIRDQYSRVRFRYIEAIGASKTLSLQFTQDLKTIAKEDKSPRVREEARRILASISA